MDSRRGSDPLQILLQQTLGAWQTLCQVGLSPSQMRVQGQGEGPLALHIEEGACRYEIPLCAATPPAFLSQWPTVLHIWRSGGMELDAEALVSGCPVRQGLVKILREMRDLGFRVPALPGPHCLLHRFDRLEGLGGDLFGCSHCGGTWQRGSSPEQLLTAPWRRWLALRGEVLDLTFGGEQHQKVLRQETEILSPEELVQQWVLGMCSLRPLFDDVAKKWAHEPMLAEAHLGLAAAYLDVARPAPAEGG